jgi:hypothetical protein
MRQPPQGNWETIVSLLHGIVRSKTYLEKPAFGTARRRCPIRFPWGWNLLKAVLSPQLSGSRPFRNLPLYRTVYVSLMIGRCVPKSLGAACIVWQPVPATASPAPRSTKIPRKSPQNRHEISSLVMFRHRFGQCRSPRIISGDLCAYLLIYI